MTSWLPIGLLALTGFLLGGVWSTARNRQWVASVALAIAAGLSALGARMWW